MNIVMSVVRPRVVAGLSIAVAGALALATGVASPSVGATRPAIRNAPAAKIVHNPCKKSKIDVPACGVLWGLYTPPVAGPGVWEAPYANIEKPIGRRFDIVKRYIGWQAGITFPNSSDRKLAGKGKRILDFSWNSINYNTRKKVSYESIADGSWDKSVILPEARRLKTFHHKVFIDFNHEFDNKAQSGEGSPAQYVAAYRHIHRVMRLAGVHNVIWTWISTGYIGHAQEIKQSYPGARYVNWVGYDPYNFAQCHSEGWKTPYKTFQPFYHWLRTQPGMKHKPIMLGEYATAPGTNADSWYAHVAPALRRLPRIKAVMQWSSVSAGCNFRINQSTATLAGFKVSSNAPYVIGLRH
jgi:hypothetical protein